MNEPTVVNAEAGDYIEDDPAAWQSWVDTFRDYAPQYAALTAHLGSETGAAEVLAGTMLSVLADRHDLYLRRESEPIDALTGALLEDASRDRAEVRAWDATLPRTPDDE